MKRIITMLVATTCVACNRGSQPEATSDAKPKSEVSYPDARTHIREAVKSPTKDTTVDHTLVIGDTLRLSEGTVTYYRSLLRRGKPVWSLNEEILPRGTEMVAMLGKADTDGLSPSRYNYETA